MALLASNFSLAPGCAPKHQGRRSPGKVAQVCRASNDKVDKVTCSRRALASGLGVGVLIMNSTTSTPAFAGSLDSYVKKRILDPLDTYVAPFIAAKEELKDSGLVAETDFQEARNMLRSGALSGFRANARAIGEYAERLETSTDSKRLVSAAILNLEKYDSALLQLSRDQKPGRDIKDLVKDSLAAMDELLKTVPSDVMKDVIGG